MTSNSPGPTQRSLRSQAWRDASSSATDQAALRAHVERSRALQAAAKSMSAAPEGDAWAIPNSVPLAIAASFALTPLFSTLGVLDLLRHYAIGAGVLIGGVILFALMRGALGAGVIKLAAALSVWIGGGEPLLTFLAAAMLLPIPLVLANGLWNRYVRGGAAGELSVPYWPTMLLAFIWIAPGVEAVRALGLKAPL